MRWSVFTAFVLLLLPQLALAFHDGGVAHCNGCHTMHNRQDGALVDPDAAGGNAWLLVDESPSDVCIGCHDHLDRPFPAQGADPLNPPPPRAAGNFVFLLEDNLNDGHGGADNPIPGDAAGHNLLAPGHGLAPDATLAQAPGGSFPAGQLGCSSCHDPHGNGNFRLLHGAGAQVQGGAFTFTRAAPDAEGLSIFATESDELHTAYRGGMSDWCGNCHGDFHRSGSQLTHPADRALGMHVATIYDRYNGTADPTGGDPASAFLAMVPFEDPAMQTTSTEGPSASSRVSCISCHRAHASSAPDAGRWDFRVSFLAEDGVESGSYPLPNPYPGPDQRSLCNKCHGKDGTGPTGPRPGPEWRDRRHTHQHGPPLRD